MGRVAARFVHSRSSWRGPAEPLQTGTALPVRCKCGDAPVPIEYTTASIARAGAKTGDAPRRTRGCDAGGGARRLQPAYRRLPQHPRPQPGRSQPGDRTKRKKFCARRGRALPEPRHRAAAPERRLDRGRACAVAAHPEPQPDHPRSDRPHLARRGADDVCGPTAALAPAARNGRQPAGAPGHPQECQTAARAGAAQARRAAAPRSARIAPGIAAGCRAPATRGEPAGASASPSPSGPAARSRRSGNERTRRDRARRGRSPATPAAAICPLAPPPPVLPAPPPAAAAATRLAEIRFPAHATALAPGDRAIIAQIAALAHRRPGTLRVVGFAKGGGSARRQLESFRAALDRAQAVAAALAQAGVPAARIKTEAAPAGAGSGAVRAEILLEP
ncbi:MAG: OmpA family protein [Stellaceae bacterium]